MSTSVSGSRAKGLAFLAPLLASLRLACGGGAADCVQWCQNNNPPEPFRTYCIDGTGTEFQAGALCSTGAQCASKKCCLDEGGCGDVDSCECEPTR
ncbi:MAG: hypothetical protein HY791_18565 [Deltaproteobacteria bacterium]|nr:hypothetical protein [Deltaproteobacteria bacterium]